MQAASGTYSLTSSDKIYFSSGTRAQETNHQ